MGRLCEGNVGVRGLTSDERKFPLRQRRISIVKLARNTSTCVLILLVVANQSLASPPRALWLWNTEELIARADLREELLRVRDKLDIEDVFLNFPHRFERVGDKIHCMILQEDSVESLIRWASARELKIFALAGEPEWALREFSDYADAFTHAVLQFAQQLPDDATISGIHLDVEPHLLIQFASPVLRTQLYVNLIQLHQRLADVVHAASTLEYGADMAFWMNDSVNVGGRSAPVAEHVLQNVDHLSVLAYRDEAEGVNGILELAEKHIALAEKLGKQVYVGVETQELRFRAFQFVLGNSEIHFRTALSDGCHDGSSVLSNGQRIVAVEVFGTVHVGVPMVASQEDLLDLAECFGQSIDDIDAEYIGEELDKLRFWSRHLGEWENPQLGVMIGREGKRYQTFSMREKELLHVSFWEETPAHFWREVTKVDSALSERSGYRGLAVHDFRWVSRLLLE